MKYAIALDIGGTKIKGVLINERRKVLKSMKIPTGTTKKNILFNINSVIESMMGGFAKPLEGIAISMPGACDKNGKIIFAGSNLQVIEGYNLGKSLKKKFDLPVVIENDANSFALAEYKYGKYKNKSTAGIIWGTGIGVGIVQNGKILKGSLFRAGEIGRMYLNDNYTIEDLAGGRGIHERHKHLTGENASVKTIMQGSNDYTKHIRSDAIFAIAKTIEILAKTINPEVIIIGGGVSNTTKKNYALLRSKVKKLLDKDVFDKTIIESYTISDDEGYLGAVSQLLE